MAIKKKKISELTLSDNLKGLYTIGVKLINGVQTSVKVSLEYIQTAYENAVKATNSANEAAKSANNAASSANTATSNANKATEAAKTATNNANEATQQAKTATSNANLATQKANTAATNADNARKGLEEIKVQLKVLQPMPTKQLLMRMRKHKRQKQQLTMQILRQIGQKNKRIIPRKWVKMATGGNGMKRKRSM